MSNQSPIMKTSVSSKVFQNIALNVYNKKNPKMQVISFSQINSAQLAIDNSGHAIACPDQYVGIINIEKNGCVSNWNVGWEKDSIFIKDKTKRQSNSDTLQNEDISVMAIVLESPHKDEFDNNQAIGPAIGTTGNNIEKYLPKEILDYLARGDEKIPSGRYKVLLINAIQYQCSLGTYTNKYRDKIFSKMWKSQNINKENEDKNDFCNRLESHNPKVVINCCTKGKFKNKEIKKHLRKLVQNKISEYCNGKNILELRASHPSRWDIKRNRRITKV